MGHFRGGADRLCLLMMQPSDSGPFLPGTYQLPLMSRLTWRKLVDEGAEATSNGIQPRDRV